jgi:prepilin-type N-terminal cleavage/methylation domain-containing protein
LARSRFTDETGFSLAEVMIASLLLCVGLVSLAQLFAISTRSTRPPARTRSP